MKVMRMTATAVDCTKRNLTIFYAVKPAESGRVTVVVVPLISLLKDLLARLKDKGIRVMRWDNEKTIHYQADVILVISETAASDAFHSYFLKGCQEGRIVRLVLDEIGLYDLFLMRYISCSPLAITER
jgi:hypothetical protein